MNKDYLKLMDLAKDSIRYAYAPYSKFRVGAALLMKDGSVYTGCNVENASYGLSICAERVAIAKAVSAGKRDLRAIAVIAEKSEVTPCGACRQFISEFGTDIDIIYIKDGHIVVKKIADLLPEAFNSACL
jgi:cytidine deaminase